MRESHRRLEAVGVAASRPLEFVESLSGWWAEGIPGRALEPAREEPGVWAAFGELLARAHAAHGGDLPTTDGRAASLDAARKQVSLVRLADPAFADELDRDLSELPVDGTTGRSIRAAVAVIRHAVVVRIGRHRTAVGIDTGSGGRIRATVDAGGGLPLAASSL